MRFRGTVMGLALLALAACDSRDSSGEFYTNWDLAGGCSSDEHSPTRPSAAGGEVDVCADVGRYEWIWVSYAGGWCRTSQRQAPHVHAFQRAAGRDVAVYTVLTSGQDPFVGATVRDARAWAGAYRLPASHVLVEESTRVIPQHLLIGPDGRTWYRYVGFLPSEEMREILRDFASGARTPNVR